MTSLSVRQVSPLAAFLFLLPALVLFCMFFVYPLLFVAGISFTEWNGVSPPKFIGLKNYIQVLGNNNVRSAIKNNFLWAFALGVVQIGLALVVALILSRKPKGWKFMRTLYFLPNVISKVAIAALWLAMYNAEFGAINALLTKIGLERYAINWLGNLTTALPAVMFQEVIYIGYFMIILMAGRAAIPDTLYDAASIDGANQFQQDLRITIPILKPVILTASTVAIAFGLRHFEATFLMTDGGPANSTTVLGLQLFRRSDALRYGQANAVGMVLIVIGALTIGVIHAIFGEQRRDKSA